MGDDQHRAALISQAAHDGQHFAGQLGVQRRGRLVEIENLGVVGDGAGNSDALLLAAGKLVGQVVLAALEAEDVQHVLEALLVHGTAVEQDRQRHVLDDVEDRHEVVELVDEADLAAPEDGELLVASGKDVLAVEVDAARGGPVDAADHVQHC